MRDFCFICGISSYKFESRSYVRTAFTSFLTFLVFFANEF